MSGLHSLEATGNPSTVFKVSFHEGYLGCFPPVFRVFLLKGVSSLSVCKIAGMLFKEMRSYCPVSHSVQEGLSSLTNDVPEVISVDGELTEHVSLFCCVVLLVKTEFNFLKTFPCPLGIDFLISLSDCLSKGLCQGFLAGTDRCHHCWVSLLE